MLPIILISVWTLSHAGRGCVIVVLWVDGRLGVDQGCVHVSSTVVDLLAAVVVDSISGHVLGEHILTTIGPVHAHLLSVLLLMMFLSHVMFAPVVVAQCSDVSLVLETGLASTAHHLGQLHVSAQLVSDWLWTGLMFVSTVVPGTVRHWSWAGAGARLCSSGDHGTVLHHLQHPRHPSTSQQWLHVFDASSSQQWLHVLQVAQLLLQSLLLLQRQSESLGRHVDISCPAHHAATSSTHLCLESVLQVGDLQSLLYHPLGLLFLSVHLWYVNLETASAGEMFTTEHTTKWFTRVGVSEDN